MPPDPSSVYVDDPNIGDDEILYRMVTVGNTKFENGTAVRGATNAFQDYPADRLHKTESPAVAVSVYLESELRVAGLSVEDLAKRWSQGYGVVSLRAGDARAEDQGIMRLPTDADPEHAVIFCMSGPKKTGGQSKRLARASEVVIPPTG